MPVLIERLPPWLNARVGQSVRLALRRLKAGVLASGEPRGSVPAFDQRLAVIEAVLARVLDRLAEMNESLARLPAEIARSCGDDTRTLVRLNAVTQNRVADLSAAVQEAFGRGPEGSTAFGTIDACLAGLDKHVIYFGRPIEPLAEGTPGYLAALRRGLDVLDESVNVWIEHCKEPDPADPSASVAHLTPADEPLLSRDRYVRILRGGTRSIEVHRLSDALAVHHALAQNGRTDILTMMMCHGDDPRDPNAVDRLTPQDTPDGPARTLRDKVRQRQRLAFQQTPIWIFPSRAIYDAYLEAIPALAEDRDGKDVRIEPDRGGGVVSAPLLTRAYLDSLAAILNTHARPGSRPTA